MQSITKKNLSIILILKSTICPLCPSILRRQFPLLPPPPFPAPLATCKFYKLLRIFFIFKTNSTRTFLHVLFRLTKTLSFFIKKEKMNKRTKKYNYVNRENVRSLQYQIAESAKYVISEIIGFNLSVINIFCRYCICKEHSSCLITKIDIFRIKSKIH